MTKLKPKDIIMGHNNNNLTKEESKLNQTRDNLTRGSLTRDNQIKVNLKKRY